MAGGYIAAPEAPNPYKDEPIYPLIAFNAPFEHPEAPLRAFLASHGVTAVVLAQSGRQGVPWRLFLRPCGAGEFATGVVTGPSTMSSTNV